MHEELYVVGPDGHAECLTEWCWFLPEDEEFMSDFTVRSDEHGRITISSKFADRIRICEAHANLVTQCNAYSILCDD